MSEVLQFEVLTPLGFAVRCSEAYWQFIISEKHPVLAGREAEVKETLMDKIKVVHDAEGQTLTVWIDDPANEAMCEETTDEVVLMKDATGRVIGFELLHYCPADAELGLAVETVIRAAA